jgi:hypothetical protein
MEVEQVTDSIEEGFLSRKKKPENQEGVSLEELASKQMDEVYSQMALGFEGGLEEIQDLVEEDAKKLKELKKNKLPFNPDDEALSAIEEILGEEEPNPTAMIASSIPGSSLTGKLKDETKGTLGSYPWENPPVYDNPIDAYVFILDSMEEEIQNINELLLAGIPAESIARATTFLFYTEGLIPVDISELLVMPIMFHLVSEGQKKQIDVRIFNDVPDDAIDPNSVLDIMSTLNPEVHSIMTNKATEHAEEVENSLEMVKEDPVIGTFLSMGEEEDVD